MDRNYIEIAPQPGIDRDGTTLDTLSCIDGQWVRFYRGRPKKIGGYKLLYLGNTEVISTLYNVNALDSVQVFMGQKSKLLTMSVFQDFSITAPVDITPADYVTDSDTLWSFATASFPNVETDTISPYIFAIAPPNRSDIANNIPSYVYTNTTESSAQLFPIQNTVGDQEYIQTDGTIFNLGPYLVMAGSLGKIQWTIQQSYDTWPDENRILYGTSKFVYGTWTRAGGTFTALLWALNYVVSMTYAPTDVAPDNFNFAYVSTSTTILSSACIVSYEPYFYWIGIDTFYMYNGSIIEVDNKTNKLWFFENLNEKYKQNITTFVNKKYHEIWWLFPKGDSTVNNWALIYNVQLQAWYDTPLSRAGVSQAVTQFPYPMCASSEPFFFNGSSTYPLWAHEVGVNAVTSVTQSTAIVSSFTTNKLSLLQQNPNACTVVVDTLIPDIKQNGNMIVQVALQGYPNSTPTLSPYFQLTPQTEFITPRQKGTIISLTFTSNEIDGDYLFGRTLVGTVITTDQRMGPSSS